MDEPKLHIVAALHKKKREDIQKPLIIVFAMAEVIMATFQHI